MPEGIGVRKLKILIADDQALMRDGLKAILELEADMEVVGLAANGLEAYELTAFHQPDLVIMDVKMPLMNGVESTKRIKRDFPNTQILMLTMFSEEEYIIEALANGACGFLLKDMPSEQLLNAIRQGAKGETMLPSSVAAKLVARLSASRHQVAQPDAAGHTQAGPQFTEREKEIISYMIQNLSNREIARKVGITEGTLKNYITSIYDKIGINHRLKAITYLRKLFQGGQDASC